MIELIKSRLQEFKGVGSMGIVKDTRYINCYWPSSPAPFSPFAEGSSGIEVQGPPTPRNIVFPPGTKFLNGTRGDCFYTETIEVREVEKATGPEIKRVVKVDGKDTLITYRDTEKVIEKVRVVKEIKDPKVGL